MSGWMPGKVDEGDVPGRTTTEENAAGRCPGTERPRKDFRALTSALRLKAARANCG